MISIGSLRPAVLSWLARLRFRGSSRYWEWRYRWGGTSGAGSYGALAAFKADFVNDFVARHDIGSVIDFGCGDGNQLALAKYPRYIGLDVSASAIARLQERYKADPSKQFLLLTPTDAPDAQPAPTADCALSLDVIYHLVEDAVFETYMRRLFRAGRRFVIVYSSNFDAPARGHVRHRRFLDHVAANAPEFELFARVANALPQHSTAEFFVFKRNGPDARQPHGA